VAEQRPYERKIGGPNLCGFVGKNPVLGFDHLGLPRACLMVRFVEWLGPDFDRIQNASMAYKAYGWPRKQNQRLLLAVCKRQVSTPWVC